MNGFKAMAWSLALVWWCSGLLPIALARTESLQLLADVGIALAWQWPLLVAASVVDVMLGVWIVWRPSRVMWLLQALLVAFYSVVIALYLPQQWLHPFGPLVKNLPIMAMIWCLWQNETRRV